MRFIVARPPRDGLLEHLDCLGGPAGLPQHDTKREWRLSECGAQFKSAAQRDLCALEVVVLFQRDAEVVKGLRVQRIAGGQFPQHRHRTLEIAAIHQRGPEVQASGMEVRVSGYQRAKCFGRRLSFAMLRKGEAEAVARLA